MRFGSACSGIEAASVAWAPLGWTCAWASEIDAAASAVLAHRWPETRNLGDVIGLAGRLTDDERAIELLVGGTPCQGFSTAGKRGGLDDPRSRLAWEFLGLADRARPRWVVWENVAGCLSTAGGRDFGAIIGALEGLGYGVAWRVLDAQFVRVGSHPRGVPQQRRRVYVVGYLGDWRPSVGVLLEPASLRGDPPPRRKAGEEIAGTLSARASGGGGLGGDFECAGGPQAFGGGRRGRATAVTLMAHGRGLYFGSETLVVAGALRSHPFPGSDTTGALVLSVDAGQDPCVSEGVAGVRARPPGVAVLTERGPLLTPSGGRGGMGVGAIATDVVRRLTPLECERLQGFPDGYTAIPFRGRTLADTPRYRLLGNSMPVNVMGWIGERIALFERVTGEG